MSTLKCFSEFHELLLLLFSHLVLSDSLQPHGLQHARLPGPSLSPGVCSNSCPLSWWCHPTISSSATPFSSCLQSFPASGSFPMSWFFASGGQSIGASASASVLPLNIQGWFPLGLTGLVSKKIWHGAVENKFIYIFHRVLIRGSYKGQSQREMGRCRDAGFEDEKLDHEPLKNKHRGIFLVVQWLRLPAPNAGGPGFSPWSGN